MYSGVCTDTSTRGFTPTAAVIRCQNIELRQSGLLCVTSSARMSVRALIRRPSREPQEPLFYYFPLPLPVQPRIELVSYAVAAVPRRALPPPLSIPCQEYTSFMSMRMSRSATSCREIFAKSIFSFSAGFSVKQI